MPPIAPQIKKVEDNILEIFQRWPQHIEKIVYVLSHRYTEKSISFHNLKGSDRAISEVVKAAAGRTKLNLYLILLRARFGRSFKKTEDNLEIGYKVLKWVPIIQSRDSANFINNVRVYDLEIIPANFFDDVPGDQEKEHNSEEEYYLERWYERAALVFWPETNHYKILISAFAYSAANRVFKIFMKRAELCKDMPRDGEEWQDFMKFADSLACPFTFRDRNPGHDFYAAVVSLEDFELTKKMFSKYSILEKSAISLLVAQCEKYGWMQMYDQLEAVICGINRRRALREKAPELIREIFAVGKNCNEEKKETAKRILQHFLEDKLEMRMDEEGVRCWLESFKLAVDLELELGFFFSKPSNYMVGTVAPMLLKIGEVHSKKRIWIQLCNSCIERLEIIFSSELVPNWIVPYKFNICCKCDICKELAGFLKQNRFCAVFKPEQHRHIKRAVGKFKEKVEVAVVENAERTTKTLTVQKKHLPKYEPKYPEIKDLLEKLRGQLEK